MRKVLKTAVLLLGLGWSGLNFAVSGPAAGRLIATGLRCEHVRDPVKAGGLGDGLPLTLESTPKLRLRVPPTDSVKQAQDVVFLRMEPDHKTKTNIRRAIFKVGSGEYEFHSRF